MTSPTIALATRPQVAILGGGPSGLMAAEILAVAGASVDLYDAMPSVGRKFLLAGIGGMNITHSEPLQHFISRYGSGQHPMARMLTDFSPDALRAWLQALGIATFVGSSGKVFPVGMKAAPLLRAWLARIKASGVRIHVRHRWCGWDEQGALRLLAPDGELRIRPQATILALGGASWPRLGSDGAWWPWLHERGVELAQLQPANCGFDAGWSHHLAKKFAGAPLKNIALRCVDDTGTHHGKKGECVLTATGLEGNLIYAHAALLRDQIAAHGQTTIWLDLLPDHDAERVLAEVSHPRGSRSLSSHLQSRLGLGGAKAGLLRECLSKDDIGHNPRLAAGIKALPITLTAARPLAEAISSAGGVRFAGLNDALMLKALPGVFCAGEMLDWEAPTGGYLLTGCFATGRAAGVGACRWLDLPDPI